MISKWNHTDILIRIPLLLYGAGFVIHTAYLAQFSVFESDLLQARYIFGGAMAVMFIGVSIWLSMMGLNLKTITRNFNPFNLMSWIGRICVFAIASYLSLEGGNSLFSELPFTMGSLSANTLNNISTPLISLSFLNIIINSAMPNYNKADIFWDSIFKKIQCMLSPVFITIAIFAAISNPIFLDVLKMYALIVGFIFAAFLGRNAARHGFISAYLDETEEPQKQRSIIHSFAPLLFILPILMILFSYGQLIYPILPSNLGGAKPVLVKVILGDKAIEGELISEGSKWITICKRESNEVYRLNIIEIEHIEY